MFADQFMKLSCGLLLVVFSNSLFGMEIHLSERWSPSERWSDVVVATFSDTGSDYSVFSLQDPNRVVIDAVNLSDTSEPIITGVGESSIVKRVRHGIHDGGRHRYVFDISEDYEERGVDWWQEEKYFKLVIPAHPKGYCTPNSIGHDVCESAREMTQSLANQLPLSVNRDITIEKAVSSRETVYIFASLTYSDINLVEFASANGMSVEDLKAKTSSSTRDRACFGAGEVKSFIGLGGVMVYHYAYSDGSDYLTVKVTDCE